MPNSRHYRLAKGLIIERFGDQAVIFNPEGSRILVVNRASAELFSICRRELGRSVFTEAGLAAVVHFRFSLTSAQARREAARILPLWEKTGILIPAGV